MAKQTEDYTPFGEEWVKEMKKFPKEVLIELLKTSHLKRKELEAKLEVAISSNWE